MLNKSLRIGTKLFDVEMMKNHPIVKGHICLLRGNAIIIS